MPDQAIPRNAYSALVAGVMNPQLHHPQWYNKIGAITDEELVVSLKSGSNATTPIVSRLQFGDPTITVHCQPNLWMAQAITESSWPRLIKTAELVFAKANNPNITAYGIMTQRHIDTDCNVKKILAEKVAKMNLGLPSGEDVTTNVTLAVAKANHTINTSVQLSVLGERTIFGIFHLDFPSREIESIADGRFDRFMHESNKFFGDIVAAMNICDEKGGVDE